MALLTVLRHAKSDWSRGLPDHERVLNDRGRRTAPAVGRALAAMDLVPDLVLTSSAERARSTAELARAEFGAAVDLVVTDALYATSVNGALAAIADVPAEVEHLLIVGHEPTWSALVGTLTGARVEMATATLAGIMVPSSGWDGLDADAANGLPILEFVLPGRRAQAMFGDA